MIYISIDLSQKSTGVALTNGNPSHLWHFTIKDLLETKYKECDLEQIKLALEKLEKSLERDWQPYFYNYTILIEYNVNPMNVRFEKFSLSFIFYMFAKWNLKNIKIIPIQASRWMKVANETFSIKRNKYPNNKEGNKKWISDLCKHLAPNITFDTQDEKDAFLMLKTYLEKPNRF